MATGFNALTSPLTLSSQQTNGIGQYTPAASSTASVPKTVTSAPASAPTPDPIVTPTYDPIAAAAAKARANAQADFNSGKDLAYGAIGDAQNESGRQLGISIQDYIDSLRSGQRTIDQAGVQNELSREQGRLGVLDTVGTGIRSGGVVLNNAGGANSGAAEEIAKAYGQVGRKQMTQVGNQYALGENNIRTQQQNLDDGTATFQRKFGESKVTAVNSIVQDATTKLAALNAAAQNASIGERINIEQEKQRINAEATQKLSAYDQVLSNSLGGVKAADKATNRTSAQQLLQAGTAPENAFDYTTSIPAAFQNTGGFSTSLPLFAGTGKKPDQFGV